MHPKDHPSAFRREGRTRGFEVARFRLHSESRDPTPAVERVMHLRASHPEYPLERTCKHLHERFQLAFARGAAELLQERDDRELLPSPPGLTIDRRSVE